MIMYTEFLAATIEACGRIEDDRLAEAFDRLDCDDTGYSKSEPDVTFFVLHGWFTLSHIIILLINISIGGQSTRTAWAEVFRF